MTVLLGAWSSICGVWATLILAQFRVRREGLLLRPRSGDSDSDDTLPSVAVVIPARNEAAALEHCLRHVLTQDYPDLSVVVADDRSDDDTASIADRIAKSDARVRVLRIEELPDGWMGKSHALWRATREVASDWLLFIDVDCTLSPKAVGTAVREARGRGVAFLSLWPGQTPGGFWEHLLIPLCAGIIALWFGGRRRAAFANGQFMLIERRAYERIGGHWAVRSALIEDVPLAERAAEVGVRPWVASGREIVSVRMYEGLRAIVRGWARIYVGALRSGSKLVLSVLWLVFGSLPPYVAAVCLLLLAVYPSLHGDRNTLVAVGALCASHAVLMMVASWRFWGMGGCKRVYLLLYPLSVVIVIGILLRAGWWLIVRRQVPWRDRCYAINRRGVIVG